MKKLILFVLIFGIHLTIRAQANGELQSFFESVFPETSAMGLEIKPTPDSAAENDVLFIPESWDVNLDSLMNSWHIQHYVDRSQHYGYREAVIASDSVYVERLSRLNNIMELPYNEIVRRCIDLYVDRRRNTVEYMLGLEQFYFPMIEQALDENNLPDELKYLAVVESALNPVAVSRAGATGLWQFMLQTGKQYGLEVNSLVDERRDPLKATYAACEYFKDMYRIYGDWTLVIAAYNCGPGNVNKAIRRAGGSTDYWKIYPFLPRETRSYVPLFVAATYVMNYHAYHHLHPVQTSLPLVTDTIMVNEQIHFDQIAAVLNIDKAMLRALNPQYKRDIVPGNSKPRAIKLPALQTYAFVELKDSIQNYRKEELFTNRTYVAINEPTTRSTGSSTGNYHNYKVRSGDSFYTIAKKYPGYSSKDLMQINNMSSSRLRVGQIIKVPNV
jgi:membrane-bound lytic murein transglycosylase D